jgi:hypothetical protein
VLNTVTGYAEGLTHMDVAQIVQVWPSVDQRAVRGAFRSLSEHHVAFDACALDISEDVAHVTCHATVEFVPKIGNTARRRNSQQWNFTLKRSGQDWEITAVTATEEHTKQ